MILPLVGFFLLLPMHASTTPALPATAATELPTPNDPKARLELGAKVNGLHGFGTPWHLRASYEVVGADGESSDKGTYEEWRVSENQYRIAFHGPSLSVEEFGTDHGVFRTGGQEWPRHPLSSIPELLTAPVSQPQSSQKTVLENFQQSFGGDKLPCTALKKPGFQQTPKKSWSFCFSSHNTILLYASAPNDGFQTIFEHIKLVHGQYLAYDIQQLIAGGPWMKVHVDLLESLTNAGLSALALPADAFPVTRRINAPGEIDPGHLGKKAVPVYPLAVKLKGIQGTVVLNAIISRDGHVTGLRVLAGPPMLRQPAIDAVRQWVYTPSLRGAEPVEVETDMSVVFEVIR